MRMVRSDGWCRPWPAHIKIAKALWPISMRYRSDAKFSYIMLLAFVVVASVGLCCSCFCCSFCCCWCRCYYVLPFLLTRNWPNTTPKQIPSLCVVTFCRQKTISLYLLQLGVAGQHDSPMKISWNLAAILAIVFSRNITTKKFRVATVGRRWILATDVLSHIWTLPGSLLVWYPCLLFQWYEYDIYTWIQRNA